jgi:hypothetical protein
MYLRQLFSNFNRIHSPVVSAMCKLSTTHLWDGWFDTIAPPTMLLHIYSDIVALTWMPRQSCSDRLLWQIAQKGYSGRLLWQVVLIHIFFSDKYKCQFCPCKTKCWLNFRSLNTCIHECWWLYHTDCLLVNVSTLGGYHSITLCDMYIVAKFSHYTCFERLPAIHS